MKQSLVNSFGVVFNVVTTQKLQGYAVFGSPDLHDSWFPDYAWEILICGRCHEHLGWRFSTTKSMPFFSLIRLRGARNRICRALWSIPRAIT